MAHNPLHEKARVKILKWGKRIRGKCNSWMTGPDIPEPASSCRTTDRTFSAFTFREWMVRRSADIIAVVIWAASTAQKKAAVGGPVK